MPSLILASGSPRRRALLGGLGISFEVRPADVDESPRAGEAPGDLVRRLAVSKAEAALATDECRALAASDGVVVLAADTIVALGDEVLGKPVDDDDAAAMLRRLSGTSHRVLTGVAVASSHGGAAALTVEVEVTVVHMGRWTGDDITAYVATGEPRDKAGSYAIQEVGDRFVRSIEGNFDNVVGLPMALTRRLLADAGLPT